MQRRRKLARAVDLGRAHPETGEVIEKVVLEVTGVLTPRQLKAERARMAEAAKANASIDYLIKSQERALRSGRWQPPKRQQLLEAIDRFRRYRQLLKRTPEIRGKTHVAAFRLGYLFAEADFLARAPIVRQARVYRANQGGRARKSKEARTAKAQKQLSAFEKTVARNSKVEETPSLRNQARNFLAGDDAEWQTRDRTAQERKINSLLRARRKKKRT